MLNRNYSRSLKITFKFYYIFILAVFSYTSLYAQSKKPNIVFILADDFGWNQIGANGNTLVRTPNIDQLAKEGINFKRAYVMPQCSPTRAALLSGKYPARSKMTKVIHEGFLPNAPLLTPEVCKRLPEEWYNIAKMLKDTGYMTGITGKWHVADNYSVAPLLNSQGIEYFNRYGFDWAGKASESDYPADKAVNAITAEAIEFIDNNRERPFFLLVSHFTTHSPLAAPSDLIEKYEELGYGKSTLKWGNTSERVTADYMAMTEHFDKSVGEIVKKLRNLNIEDNTLIVMIGDNGALGRLWDHSPLRGSKGTFYEGGIRTPLIIKWPVGIKAGQENYSPVHVIDFYPTFMELASGSKPAKYKIDGRSFVRLFNNKEEKSRTLYFHHPHYTAMYAKTPSSCIIEDNYKLIYHFGDYMETEGYTSENQKTYGKLVVGKKVELYDLNKDIGEEKDISEQMPEKVEYLVGKLKKWWKETDAHLPEENKNYDPANPFHQIQSETR